MATTRTGEILVKRGLLTQEQLQLALEAQQGSGKSLEQTLIEKSFVSESDLIGTLSAFYGIPTAELNDVTIDETALKLVPFNLASKHSVMPLHSEHGVLTIAISEPANISALNEIKFITGLDIQLRLASSRSISQLHEQFYQSTPAYDSLIGDVVQGGSLDQKSAEETDLADLIKATEDAPIVKLVNAILADSVRKGASDIHVEPYEKGFRVRFRIDGVLTEIMHPPLRLKNAVTSRLKIMSAMDIAERRLPQDGRIKVRCYGDRDSEFRVNVLPTLFGEKVVLRLLDAGGKNFDISKMGFDPVQREAFEHAISQPHGMILVTGPTGSGKTTTLYAALSALNEVGINICTAEDPVEINVPGINQSQVNPDIGFTFAEALRAFLRQDPDVVMVGEIRDFDTAEIAIKAALTGHLVLSTLHTNDAPSTINRMLNMGVAPYLVASSVNLIIAQRLARRLCLECREPTTIPTETLVAAGLTPDECENVQFYAAKGCAKCSDSGYRGRIALYEILKVTDELRDLILKGASAMTLKQEAVRLGMTTLRRSGLRHFREGTTTLDEVIRVTIGD